MEELDVRVKNRIISAVSCRKTACEAGLTTPEELEYYHRIRQEAENLYRRGGVWPIFDLFELD